MASTLEPTRSTDEQIVTGWVEKQDEMITVFGNVPEIGTILEREGELVQIIAHAVRVTRGFAGTKRHEHKPFGSTVWHVAARPVIQAPPDEEDE